MGEAVEALPLTPGYFGAGSRTYEEVLSLSRDPVELAATVRGWAATPTDEENGVAPVGKALEQRAVRMLAGLMVDWPLPADLAGAVGEALRQQPGVVESRAVDPDGRPAIRLRWRLDAIVGLDVPDPTTGELNNVHVADAVEHDVYLDPDTLGMLAERETVVVASARSSFLRVDAVRAMAVFGPTTELPVLPEDLPRTQVAVIGGPWQGSGTQAGCAVPDAQRVCAVLEGAQAALAVDEECPTATQIRPWEVTLVGVVGGEPVRVPLVRARACEATAPRDWSSHDADRSGLDASVSQLTGGHPVVKSRLSNAGAGSDHERATPW